jgi:signal transduction histidine kinase
LREDWAVTAGGRTRAPIALQLVALLVVSLIAAQLMTFAAVVLMPPPTRAIYRMEDVAQALKGGSLHPRYGRELTREVQKEAPAEPEIRPAHDPRDLRMRPPPEWARRELASLLGVRETEVRLIRESSFPGMIMRGPFGVRVPMRFERQDQRGPSGQGERFREQMGPGGRPDDGPHFGGEPGGGPPRDFTVSTEGPVPGDAGIVAGMIGPGPDGPPRGDVTYMAGGGPRGFGFHVGAPPLFGEFTAALRQADGQWLVVRPKPESFPNDWQRRFLFWLGGCILLTAPLGYLFARRITAPISRFARAAETLMALSGPAEVGMAARAFNDMQARLKRYIDDRTAMVGAISHDLRTPLARIRFKLEAAPEGVKAAVLADVEQMEQMIASVLAFIRDASAGRPRERLDLLSLVECVVDDAAETGQDVTLTVGQTATVEADALGLQRLLGNLVDNAVKYGTRARIAVGVADGDALVEVADDGPGLSSSDLERVFQPFYRAEAARTLDGGGVGLGLAVARSIARAHGGDVTLVSSPTGLTAKVRLPLSASEPQGRRAG